MLFDYILVSPELSSTVLYKADQGTMLSALHRYAIDGEDHVT